MMCPKCAGTTRVIGTVKGITNRRFRRCVDCGYTFQSIEAILFDDYWREYAKETLEANPKEFPKEKK